jgi:hypothetical protein
MFKNLDEEVSACDLARKRPNFSVYARDKAMMNGTKGAWDVPTDLSSKDWGPIRATYWGIPKAGEGSSFEPRLIKPAFSRFIRRSPP